MIISESESQKIFQCARFLEHKGYTRNIGNATIVYSDDGINFVITYEPNSNISDVSIKFVKQSGMYSVGWIACVRSGLNVNPHQRLENVIVLLSYIRENYSIITNIDYCKESNKLIDEFIAKETRKKMK